MSAASDAEITVELARTNTPDKLSLTDAELYDNLLEEYGTDYYSVKLAIPLD